MIRLITCVQERSVFKWATNMQLVHTGENAKCTDRYAKCTSDDPKEERIGKRVNNAKGALNAG